LARLEDLTKGASITGVVPGASVEVVAAEWFGEGGLNLIYRTADGALGSRLLYRDDERTLGVRESVRPWSFDGDGHLFRLAAEAHRISLAYLFDPMLAVHSSLIEPLPHQLTAVYGEMLPRQPLRYLLADDPGSGKTIMAGLLMKELLVRGDLNRCLVCAPGGLVEQWQDELWQKFQLPFELLTRQDLEKDLLICRLDQLSRNEDVQAKLKATEWDLVVCDEAHKMSASFYGQEPRYTKRYHLGRLLGTLCRHLLLLTATPHNGKEADFQLFLALLDGDRFEGRAHQSVHKVDVSDLMRRMVKEDLVKFDGTPLFPERRAYTVNYRLSDPEVKLYTAVTTYVREEMNRADRLVAAGQKRRGTTVGFALQTLQRRLASSPEAIYQSLCRRRKRLERRLEEEKLLAKGHALQGEEPFLDTDDIDDLYDETPESELEALEESVTDQATAARTIAELEAELATLGRLERLAEEVRTSGIDRKWEELRSLLAGEGDDAAEEMKDKDGNRRKLIIFSEHKDTVYYLTERLRTLLGRPEAVVTIHGSVGREERKKTQQLFTQDKDVVLLVATDAAGEGINLQRAHLMVNYDLPWNPNRIEQRFGRIHRIGQTEVCHLWNLVASETREGDVYARLLEKLDEERSALGPRVFDVLGQAFQEKPLRDLLLEAIRYGEQPEVKARLFEVVDRALDRDSLLKLLEERALTHDTLTFADVQHLREDMERAAARRLQPHYIGSFFREAFGLVGGKLYEREPRRYELTHVPADVRNRDRQIGTGEPVLKRYERVTFEKDLITLPGKPLAELLSPGHPLLGSLIDLILEQYRELLKRGTVLVDPEDAGQDVRVLAFLEHDVRDARTDRHGQRRVVSRRLMVADRTREGAVGDAGYAPYLDFRPATPEELDVLRPALETDWLGEVSEHEFLRFAAATLAREHLAEVKGRTLERVEKIRREVKVRLTQGINYWDHRANALKDQELAGKGKGGMTSGQARARADDLEDRMKKRMRELDQEALVSASAPVVVGGFLVVPQGLLDSLSGVSVGVGRPDEETRKRIDEAAIKAVLEAETALGRVPTEMPHNFPGYDIESRDEKRGRLWFIEVKGKAKGVATVTVSKTQILTALNKPEDFILALVEVDQAGGATPRYLKEPFDREPGFAEVSANFDFKVMYSRGVSPDLINR
jgi:superfamily II DNA or RNA helicase